MKAVRNKKYPKAQKGLAYKSKAYTKKTSAAAQAMKGSRVERGLTVRPEDYDMTTPEGRAAYKSDYRESRENRLAEDKALRKKVQSGEMTPKERMEARVDRDVRQNRETYSSRSPQRITLDGKPQKFDRDVRASMQQRGSETSGLRQNERSVTGGTTNQNKVSVKKYKYGGR
jgi:hypothetical protein